MEESSTVMIAPIGVMSGRANLLWPNVEAEPRADACRRESARATG